MALFNFFKNPKNPPLRTIDLAYAAAESAIKIAQAPVKSLVTMDRSIQALKKYGEETQTNGDKTKIEEYTILTQAAYNAVEAITKKIDGETDEYTISSHMGQVSNAIGAALSAAIATLKPEVNQKHKHSPLDTIAPGAAIERANEAYDKAIKVYADAIKEILGPKPDNVAEIATAFDKSNHNDLLVPVTKAILIAGRVAQKGKDGVPDITADPSLKENADFMVKGVFTIVSGQPLENQLRTTFEVGQETAGKVSAAEALISNTGESGFSHSLPAILTTLGGSITNIPTLKNTIDTDTPGSDFNVASIVKAAEFGAAFDSTAKSDESTGEYKSFSP